VRTNSTNGLGFVQISDNVWTDLSNTVSVTIPIGVFVDGVSAISTLVATGNTCIETRGVNAQCDFGMYLQGVVTNYHNAQNVALGMVSGSYSEVAFNATHRF
jgi:hypothetical protein